MMSILRLKIGVQKDMSKVQIDKQLFLDVCQYVILGNRNHYRDEYIKDQLFDKLESMSRRESYTEAMTAVTDEEREKAMIKYIEKASKNQYKNSVDTNINNTELGIYIF